MKDAKPKNPMGALFLTVLLNMLAFGLFIPDLQLRGRSLLGEGIQHEFFVGPVNVLDRGLILGLVLALYSITQVIVSPILGRISDRVGRRPILAACAFAMVLASVSYAFAGSLIALAASRILMGIAGGSLGAAYAYVADTSSHEERPKRMGALGAAFGIGFLIGPPLGALLVNLGGGGPFVLGLASAFLALLNFVYILAVVPESLTFADAHRLPPLTISKAFRLPGLAGLLLLFFSANFAFSNLESTFFLMTADLFHLDKMQGAGLLFVVGAVQAGVMGLLVPKVVPAFGEIPVLRAAYLIQAPALALIPFSPPWAPAILCSAALAFGGGLGQPVLSSLISKTCPHEHSGSVFGVTQSLGAFARIAGPLLGGILFEKSPYAPCMAGAILLLIPIGFTWTLASARTQGAEA